jgi:hypothetical protein
MELISSLFKCIYIRLTLYIELVNLVDKSSLSMG